MNAAREKMRVANALGELPKISAAFRMGEISYSKVRAMSRVADEQSEDFLLMVAHHGTAQHVETVIRDFRRAERLGAAADQQHDSREFNYRWDDDGSLVFNGRLPAEVGAMLMKAVQASIDQEGKEVSAETREPVSARRADAIAEMAESYIATGPARSSSADRYQVMVHVHPEATETAESHIEDGPHVTAETSMPICGKGSKIDTSIRKPTSRGGRAR